MPRSKSKRSRYRPPPRKKHKPSPKWFGASILIAMFAGVVLIVINYLGLIPGTGGTASNAYLILGLVLIALGFVMATQWH